MIKAEPHPVLQAACSLKNGYYIMAKDGCLKDQTRYIYETYTISTGDNQTANVNDIIETVNHFTAFNYLLDIAKKPLTEEIIKNFHGILKRGSSDSFKDWFNVGDYKKLENTVNDKLLCRTP